MNSTSRILDLPPPPGTEDIELGPLDKPAKPPEGEKLEVKLEAIEKDTDTKKDMDVYKPKERPIDRINPYLKNPEYVEYERKHLERRYRNRSRSYSRERRHKRRYSRSRSRDRYRRSRSRSRRRRRRYSSSRSRSPSPSYRRYKYSRRRRSRSRSISRSRSKSVSKSPPKSHRSRSRKDKKSPLRKSYSEEEDEKPIPDADTNEVDMKLDEEEEEVTKDNVFKNDGTFLEMFKKMQEQQKKVEETAPVPETSKKVLPVFGKRRGGKVLKTGLVQKAKPQNEEETTSQDAWSVYMKEVRKYKEACCDDDSKTRPLVK
ncbi:CLK4-associating serine/arginine rich protein [Diorhabda carinulata]|uniref:CLK4-associating serine/arginine rich protein n=1 Tax=Diorhabda carinulata TaxID=1163345 RepID=UPI0025A26593|nr:CLK4-associating serine/arginine rich protein [Diorhabda carinulata]XP_057662630.1 CLK4-associating serine/arginine rich protein [Diorhabda carinulata]